ncbi:CRISPR type III-A/MTUBE-associated RAMP protein Csm3 [Xenococcus sp. PCC 7305]|uniref:type III-A CRISPR-associated RAMP protein Csm3 n=1 Tax=Xenococcus sp. PCC 7305 TaxID=102125 RepID=UPI0002ACBB32|nr:type III-A CRISPR-associated RAMP protein Csm3 [Xenococcus sp. PCC 7305]ELS02935.1 CRISPR type III-A/MTUBE-associated RAMP protein Csm3 [Xenococcus sp. PCC 7305]
MPASLEQKPLVGKLRIESTIVVETGLHIGGGGENLDIGGLDKPVIRDPLTKAPYLPGSSLKGKLRSILERLLKKSLNRPGGSGVYIYASDDIEDGYTEINGELSIRFEGAKTCQISRLFGSTGTNCWIKESVAREQGLTDNNTKTKEKDGETYAQIKGRNSPARLIVRDCHLQPESAEKLKKVDTGLYMTEWKFENSIDRITAAANPRQFERVPAGSKFKFEMVYTVEDTVQAIEDLKHLAIALAILEDDALGGHGSRGYGKIRFENLQLFYRDLSQYLQMKPSRNSIQTFADISSLLEGFESLTNDINQLLPASSN